MTGMARLGGSARRVVLGLVIAASFGTAVGMLVGNPAFASGETGGSPTEPTGSGTSNCPSSNPPNQMTLIAGTPQTAILPELVRVRAAGGAYEQRRLPGHRRRWHPGHVQRTCQRRERRVLYQRV